LHPAAATASTTVAAAILKRIHDLRTIHTSW
jgi:hypothetical protein